LAWQGEQALRLPEPYGTLRFVPARGAGLSLRKLRAEAVTVRNRRGGERLRPAAQRPTRTLKNLLQEARMPSWQRQRLPLLFCGNQLVCVPGVAAAAEFQAQAGEEGIVVVWQAHGR
jgi:tRNA(Ile)-lysidine synthase